MAEQEEMRRLSITTDREAILTDPQTPEQVRKLDRDLNASVAARRPVRIPHNGNKWLNTSFVYSWHTVDANTNRPIPNA